MDNNEYMVKMSDYVELEKENQMLRKLLHDITEIDIFKEFSFPLMKRWEEQQVLSSIDYQFKTTFIKKITESEVWNNGN